MMRKKLFSMLVALWMVFSWMSVIALAETDSDGSRQRTITPIPVNTEISNINGGEPVFFAHFGGYYYRYVVERDADGYQYSDMIRYKSDGTGEKVRLYVNMFNGKYVSFQDKFLIYQNQIYYLMNDTYDKDANHYYSAIVRMNLDGSGKTIVYSLAPILKHFSIWKGRLLYQSLQGIVSSNMSGGDSRVLGTHKDVTVRPSPHNSEPYYVFEKYVLDRSTDYIYWSTFKEGLYRAKYDGSTKEELVSPYADTGRIYALYFADNHQVGYSSGQFLQIYAGGKVRRINADGKPTNRRDRFSGNPFNFYYCGRIYYHDIYGRVASVLLDGSKKELLTADKCCTADNTLGVADNGVVACLYRTGEKMIDLSSGLGGYAPPNGLAGSNYKLVTKLEEGLEVYISPDASGKYRIGDASSDKTGLVARVSTIGEKFRLVDGKNGAFYLQSTKTNLFLTGNTDLDATDMKIKRPTYQRKRDEKDQRFVFVPSGNGAFYIETLVGFPISGENKLKGKVFHGSPHNYWCLLTEK